MTTPSPISPFTCQGQVDVTNWALEWTEFDPNDYSFCYNMPEAFCYVPHKDSFQYAIPGTSVSVGNADSCQTRVSTLINSGNANGSAQFWRNQFWEQTGCPSYLRNGTWVFGCPIGNEQPQFFPNDDPSNFPACTRNSGDPDAWLVHNCQFTYTCPILGPDINYFSICCNAGSSQQIQDAFNGQNVDPIATAMNNGTITYFNTRSCDWNWCQGDPGGACLAMYQGTCQGVSPCNRHWLLTNYTKPSNDQLLTTMGIVGVNTFGGDDTGNTPVGGVDCYDYYDQTKQFAAIYGSSVTGANTFNTSLSNRLLAMNSIVQEFCSDPRYFGQGECSCYNAIVAGNVPFGPALDNPAGLSDPEYLGKSSLSMLVGGTGRNSENLVNTFRYDAYCDSTYAGSEANQRYSQLVSYSYAEGLWQTISGPCSQSAVTWAPLEYQYSTLNPNRSQLSLTNYGDVITQSGNLFATLQDPQAFPLPMPPQCWLPQCTSDALGGFDTVFRDLNAIAFAGPCPNVCYAVSGNTSVNINTISNQSFVNLPQNFVSCNFGYQNALTPFTLPCDCYFINLNVPTNFSGTLNIPIYNFVLDDSQLFSSSQLTATSALYPMIGFVDVANGGTITQQLFANLNKYTQPVTVSGNVLYSQSFNLPLYVDTNGQNPYNGILGFIALRNENQFEMDVNIKLTLWGPETAPSYAAECNQCDPNFPNNGQTCTSVTSGDQALRHGITLRATSQVLGGTPLGDNPDPSDVCIMNSQVVPFQSERPYQRVTPEYMAKGNSTYAMMLSAHTQLYGQ